jgi:hypothetical protein
MLMSRATFLGTLALATLWSLPRYAPAQTDAAPPAPGPVTPPAAAAELPAPAPVVPPAAVPGDAAPPAVPAAPDKNLLFDPPASGAFGNLAGPAVGHLQPRADYRITWFPEQPVKGQPTNLGEERQDLSAMYPLWQNGCNELSATLHVRNELYQTGAILPTTGRPFPDDLWDVRLGAMYRHLFDNGWVAGGGFNVGSASDKPFHGFDEMTVGVNAFLRIPQGEHNAWLFSIAYSPTGELSFPIPGVAFLWQPADNLRLNIGLPFAVMYRPVDDVTLDFSYMLLTTVHARATWRLCKALRVYTGYDATNEAYFLADRQDVHDRFFYYDQHVSAGLQYFLARQALLDLSAGYSFNRFFFEGQHSSDKDRNRVDVEDGPFLSLRFEWRF